MSEAEVDKELELDTLPGVGPATKQKLHDAGIYTILDLATSGPTEIADAVDIETSKAVELNNKARKKLVEMKRLEPDFINAADLLVKRKAIDRVSTGSKNLDDLLGGGIETWAMTEFYGEFGSGKCVAGTTKVAYTNDTRLHLETIGETYEKYRRVHGEQSFDGGFIVPLSSVKVIGYDGKPTPADYLYREKAKEIIRVETQRGRRIDAAAAHKFFVIRDSGLEWVNAAALGAGDSIATPKSVPSPGNSDVDEDDAFFLGLFVAEGTSNPLSITNSSRKLVNWVSSYIQRRFGFVPRIRKKDDGNYLVLLRSSVERWLGELASSNSYTKYVPESILNGTEQIVAAFLAGYFEGDAELSRSLTVSSNSKRLIEEVSYLLSAIGISSTFAVKLIETGEHYKLSVAGFDREKLSRNPLLTKSFEEVKTRNSKYGTPLGGYLKRVFKEAISGNRWHNRRTGLLSKSGTVYELLTRSAYSRKGLSDEVLRRVVRLLEERAQVLRRNLNDIERASIADRQSFRKLALSLGFPLNRLGGRLGLTKSGVNNYYTRGVPNGMEGAILSAMQSEASRRLGIIEQAKATIREAGRFNWDSVIRTTKSAFNDYVYDFSVPEGHAFVGGNLPTLMHNSQICHTLCVMVQGPKGEGGLDAGAVYIDTEGTFRPERIAEIAEARDLDPDKILSRITVARAYNSAHQELIVKDLGRVIEPNKVKLVILDSAVAHYRAEFLGRGTLAERQQRLNRFMHQLLRIAEVYNIAVVVTNQVQAAPDSFFGDPTRPTGGHVVAHTSTYRIYLRKAAKNRIARMVDSPYHPERDAVFCLDEKGVDDPSEETTRKK